MEANRFLDHLQSVLDADQIRDIANHGMSGGVSGFIYYGELKELWNEYSNDIEHYLFNLDYSLKDLVDDCDNLRITASIDQLITNMIWVVVEDYCHHVIDGDMTYQGAHELALA
jgi:hypothetical protein